MKLSGDYFSDERGASSMVMKLVLAVTIAAAVMVILLQLMHQSQDTTVHAADAISNGTKKAFTDSMTMLSG